MSQSPVVQVRRLRLDKARECFADALARIPIEPKCEVRSIAIKINICDYRLALTGRSRPPRPLHPVPNLQGAV